MRYVLTAVTALMLTTAAYAEPPVKTDDKPPGAVEIGEVEIVKDSIGAMKRYLLSRYVPVGKAWSIYNFAQLEPDCTVPEHQPVMRIVKAPQHGTVDLVPGKFFPYFKKDGPFAKCNDQKREGTMVIYRGEKGYTGPDKLTIVVFHPAGGAWEAEFTLVVR